MTLNATRGARLQPGLEGESRQKAQFWNKGRDLNMNVLLTHHGNVVVRENVLVLKGTALQRSGAERDTSSQVTFKEFSKNKEAMTTMMLTVREKRSENANMARCWQWADRRWAQGHSL